MISIVLTLIVLGLVYFCITLLPLAEPFVTIIRVIFIIAAIVVLLNVLGVHTGLPAFNFK